MSEAMEQYEEAMRITGIDDPEKALDAWMDNDWGGVPAIHHELYEDDHYDIFDDIDFLKIRLIDIEIKLKELNNDKEYILTKLIAAKKLDDDKSKNEEEGMLF